MKKILLVTGKFPPQGMDADGGSIMVEQLINILTNRCLLDIVFTRTYNRKLEFLSGVQKVFFHTNISRNDNKFFRRLANIEWNCELLCKLISQYDRVVIIHCSKAFGLERLSSNMLSKIVLFPMYLSSSYKRSGEIVPPSYTQAEKNILTKVSRIITPSITEKEDIIKDYSVNENQIVVIPRAISSFIIPRIREKPCKTIVYIASIKPQKQNYKAIILLSILKKMGVDAYLHLVGNIQDIVLHQYCISLAEKKNLKDRVFFHSGLSQEQIAELLATSDINISVSQWETFGRGILEGMYAGLPTIVLDNIVCLKPYLEPNKGIFYTSDISEMAKKIALLFADKVYYKEQSQKAIENSHVFSEEKQKQSLLNEILCNEIPLKK